MESAGDCRPVGNALNLQVWPAESDPLTNAESTGSYNELKVRGEKCRSACGLFNPSTRTNPAPIYNKPKRSFANVEPMGADGVCNDEIVP
jgi:hypothetical protein